MLYMGGQWRNFVFISLFSNHLKEQRAKKDEITRYSAKLIFKAAEEIATLQQVLSTGRLSYILLFYFHRSKYPLVVPYSKVFTPDIAF